MTTSLNHGSARIYQFPAGGRAAVGAQRPGEIKSEIGKNAPCANEIACSESWYHEEAIHEADPTWER